MTECFCGAKTCALEIEVNTPAVPLTRNSNALLIASNIVDVSGNFRRIALEGVDEIRVKRLSVATAFNAYWHFDIAP
jgi:hypothetical protein